jgi:hypothetical protein
LAETADPANRYGYMPAGPTLRCNYCEMLEIFQQADTDAEHPGSLLYQLHRKPPEHLEDDDG